MQSKRCSKCGETKALAEFHSNRTRLRPDCKECVRAVSRAYYEAHRGERLAYNEAHREERRAYNRAYDEAHREERLAHYRAYYDAHREEIRAYNEAHREERNAQIRKLDTEARKASREVATRNGEPWTPAEDKVVISSKGTVLDIAIELGRTTSSVKSRRERLRRKAVAA